MRPAPLGRHGAGGTGARHRPPALCLGTGPGTELDTGPALCLGTGPGNVPRYRAEVPARVAGPGAGPECRCLAPDQANEPDRVDEPDQAYE